MKNFLIAFSVFLVWSFFGLWLYSWLQPEPKMAVLSEENKIENRNIENEKLDSSPVNIEVDNDTLPLDESILLSDVNSKDETSLRGLKAVNKEGDIVFLLENGISIKENSPELIIPQASVNFKYKINTYLLEHSNQEVHIYSLYSPAENIETPNLGIQRATKIKQILTSVGIASEKIVIKPIIRQLDFDVAGLYKNSISFSFKDLDYDRVESVINEMPETRTVYPKFSNSGILVNDNLKELLSDIKEILKLHPDLQIDVVGHTDNIGDSIDNYRLGLTYARQVRWYLVTKGGVSSKSIKALSKGESEPIDTNQNERGRIANRRVEIVFK